MVGPDNDNPIWRSMANSSPGFPDLIVTGITGMTVDTRNLTLLRYLIALLIERDASAIAGVSQSNSTSFTSLCFNQFLPHILRYLAPLCPERIVQLSKRQSHVTGIASPMFASRQS